MLLSFCWGSLLFGLGLEENHILLFKPPTKNSSLIGHFIAKAGKIYRIGVYVYPIPINVHGWKLKTKIALKNEDTGKVVEFEGSAKKYLYKKTDGNGEVYYTYLVFYVLRPKTTAKYSLRLLKYEDTFSNVPVVVRFTVEKRNSYFNSIMVYLLVFSVFILLFLFLRFRKRMQDRAMEEEDF